MADLPVVVAADVAAVKIIHSFTAPAGEAIVAGNAVGLDASGNVVLADADTGPITCFGIATNSATLANLPVTVMTDGEMDLGDQLDGLAFGAMVFPSATAGKLGDTIVGAEPNIGYVIPSHATTNATADKLLRVHVNVS